jgi:hypothetical protein
VAELIAFREDFEIYPLMVDLAACLCTELEASGLPGTCSCAVVPGPMAVLEACGACKSTGAACGGQAWVRLDRAFPSSTFPTPDVEGATCVSPMAYIVEVGVARCVPVGKANSITGYVPPTVQQYTDSVRLQTADMQAMKRAIQCCLRTGENSDRSFVLGTYTPITPSADCGGGVWTFTIWAM